MAGNYEQIDMPVVEDPRIFDKNSGIWLERLVFNHRPLVLLLALISTLFFAWHASKIGVNASFARMIPQSHPYIQNYLANSDALRTLGNSIRIVVENPNGDIFDKEFLLDLQKINDAVYLMPGIDRGYMRSLWTPNVRWTEVTEEGYRGGPVMPDKWNGSEVSMESLRRNILRAGVVGQYVGLNMNSAMIVAPLQETSDGKALDYGQFSRDLEQLRQQYEATGRVKVHIVGFAKVVGDLIEGLHRVMVFFGISALITGICVFFYTHCLRSTVMLVLVATMGVVCQLGIMQLLGFVIDPYSILGPFLIYAIGLSHGAQKMNGIMQDIGRGTHKYVAARYTFRRLFRAGLAALLVNVVGFAVLMIIDVPVIQDLAITTSIGVCALIFTKLLLVPVLLSYIGVSPYAARRSMAAQRKLEAHDGTAGVWSWLVRFTERPRAIFVVLVAVLLTIVSTVEGLKVQIGDVGSGAPELREDSRYNRDVAFVAAHYGLSSDLFVTFLKTPSERCSGYQELIEVDRLGVGLRQLDGVQAVNSAANEVRTFNMGSYEGNPKFAMIPRHPSNSFIAVQSVRTEKTELASRNCDVLPVIAYLTDHKSTTLDRVVAASSGFAQVHNTPERQFLLAAGSAGIEAATNIVVRQSIVEMYLAVYGVVALLCFMTFRSWRATLIALIPLIITSLLCKAIMAWLGIGLKVATLPVIALGVGVGVDYALYLLGVQLQLQRNGMALAKAYASSLQFTGRVVALVGFTMTFGVLTWAWSPIKFQADMGILLAFMFIWNMVGALVMIPALSYFLLRKVNESGPLIKRQQEEGVLSATSHKELRKVPVHPSISSVGR